METLLLCDGVTMVLLLSVLVVFVVWGIIRLKVNKATLADDDFSEEVPTSDNNHDDPFEVGDSGECLLPPKRWGKYSATSQTDAVLQAFPEFLPKDAVHLADLRKEWKTLGGKAQMTLEEKTRYAAIGHVLTVFEARKE